MDLLIRKEGKLIPVEIKSAHTFNESFLKGIDHFKATAGDRVSQHSFIVCNCTQSYAVKGTRIVNLMLNNPKPDILEED